MKQFIILLLAIGFAALGEISAPGPAKIVFYGACAVLALSLSASEVIRRRRSGESWSRSLAGSTKLLTGNVWLDALVFVGVLAICCGAIVLMILYS
jgi:hypothetical protein